MRKKIMALVAAVAFTVAACGPKVLITSEQVLAASGRSFVETGRSFNEMCQPDASPKMDPKTCEGWKKFAPEFQEKYAVAEKLWNDLAACELAEAEVPTGRDCGSKDEIINSILAVKNTLMQYAFKVLAVKGGK